MAGASNRSIIFAAQAEQAAIAQLKRRLKTMEPRIAKKLERRAIRPAAKIVAEEAKRRVPKSTGELARSIKVRALKRSRRNRGRVGARVVTGKELFHGDQYYGGMVEYGTSRMPAQPFLRPAANRASPAARRMYRNALASAINEEASR